MRLYDDKTNYQLKKMGVDMANEKAIITEPQIDVVAEISKILMAFDEETKERIIRTVIKFFDLDI
jgi:hypothetical protein